MSSAGQRPTPSQMTLQALKTKRKGAFQGFTLLKSKSDSLTTKFRSMLKELIETKMKIGEELTDAAFDMAKATYTAGEFKMKVIENVKRPAVTLKLSTENVSGVKLPLYCIQVDPSVDVIGNIGCTAGGQVINEAKQRYMEVLNALVKLATLQTMFFTLDKEIRMTNRRVNALDNVVIPALDENISYITKELDELEREEFCRLKKISAKKKNKAKDQETYERTNIAVFALSDEKDQDIIF